MRNRTVQMSLLDAYHSVGDQLENNKPELFKLLDERLDWDDLIPNTFYLRLFLPAHWPKMQI